MTEEDVGGRGGVVWFRVTVKEEIGGEILGFRVPEKGEVGGEGKV